jgi:ubiquinone/menaquinone biosynthesis C-methylase UbiE
MRSYFRSLLKSFHPQGIPWPGTVLYNCLSKSPVFQFHYELVARDIIKYCPAGRLLDIGTGPGRLLLELAEHSKQLQITGIDISAAMVKRALANLKRAGYNGKIEVREGAAEKLPFSDNYFEAVVSTGAIHHWKDPGACLNDIHRVLRPGGYVLLYDLVRHTPQKIRQEFSWKFGRTRTTLFWLHSFEEPFYSQEEFSSLATGSPFAVRDEKFVGLLYGVILKK